MTTKTMSESEDESSPTPMCSSTDQAKVMQLEFELGRKTRDAIIGNLSQHTTLSDPIVRADAKEKMREANVDLVATLMTRRRPFRSMNSSISKFRLLASYANKSKALESVQCLEHKLVIDRNEVTFTFELVRKLAEKGHVSELFFCGGGFNSVDNRGVLGILETLELNFERNFFFPIWKFQILHPPAGIPWFLCACHSARWNGVEYLGVYLHITTTSSPKKTAGALWPPTNCDF